MEAPLVELKSVSKYFGSVIALKDVSFDVRPGEVHCLLGDNGAGKSTLIKVLSGVHNPDEGEILVGGTHTRFKSPKDTLDKGIATVYQDLALVPLMSVARNFFLGREPLKKTWFLNQFDVDYANRTSYQQLSDMGIQLRNPQQPVGTLSGGERQCLAIARAIHFGAKVLILDEPTAALGVKQATHVLRIVHEAKRRGLAVIFITHQVMHAMAVGDHFAVLIRGAVAADFRKGEKSREEITDLMAGGETMANLEAEIEAHQSTHGGHAPQANA